MNELSTSLDILPTILDVLDINPNLIATYPGHSLLRPSTERFIYTVGNPGDVYPVIRKNSLKALLYDTGEVCGRDLDLDPVEERAYWCTKSAWYHGPWLVQSTG